MKRMLMTLTALTVTFLVAGAGGAKADGLDIRFDASINTPQLSVRIGNTPGGYRDHHRIRHLPARRVSQVRLVQADWRIAARLAWYTGTPEGRIIRLRRMGYRWDEIGMWLGMPRPAIRAAMQMKTWKRYLRRENAYADSRGARHKGQRKGHHDGR
ncbi:MAG TPA: hypothetical protein VLA34_06525 [Candidatus Krumholzibacterium sp.]|nr:hypothetical protein [Candidatus Krumholzibacterium sp.]